MKPGVIEKGLATNKNFANLSDGFKRIFTADAKELTMKIPIVGYTGHRKGEKAENMFAKNFRENTYEAVRNKRIAAATTTSNFIKS